MQTQRLFTLAATYLATLSTLARTELADDLAATKAALVRRGIAAGLLLLGFVWLNIALLVWLLQTEWRLLGPLAIGGIGVLLGLVLLFGSKAKMPGGYLARTKAVVSDEIAAMGFASDRSEEQKQRERDADPDQPPPVPERLSPEGAHARMRDLRIQLGQILSPTRAANYVEGGAPPPAVGFQPQSRTMQWMVDMYQTGAAKKLPAIAGSVVSLLVSRNPKLRRTVAMLALLRGAARLAGQRMRRV